MEERRKAAMNNPCHHIMSVSLSFILLLLSCAGDYWTTKAHTFHTSLAQMEYNAQEKSLEISLEVFTQDLETVLSRRSGKKVRLDKTDDTANLVLAYLQETLNLKNAQGEVKQLAWVGMETQADAVWLYVEAPMPEGLERATLRDRILFETLEDQVNIVHLKYEGKKADLVFKPGDEFKAISSPRREQ
jgi:hypothetical protein